MLENVSSYNLDVAPEVGGSQQDSITRLITKSGTTFVAFYCQLRLKNLFSREKTYLHTRNIIYWPYTATLVVSFSGSKIISIRIVPKATINSGTFEFTVSTQP